MSATERAFYNSLWQQAAAQGMSVFVSSGDAGAAGCSTGSDTTASLAAVNGLCSSPYATCVGGTQFDEGANPAQYWAGANSSGYGSAQGYIPEVVWNESGANGGTGMWASGGGISTLYTQPAWQTDAEGGAAANGMRGVPDVALAAADHDGSIVVANGAFAIASGTSIAAPAWSGILALVVQMQRGAAQGNVNPKLYSLAQTVSGAFHPTPAGNNSVPGVSGFTANHAVYNLATSLGSVDALVLAQNWNPASLTVVPPPRFCPTRLVRVRCAPMILPLRLRP
jgi:pseudomonalisin